jgi:hypothetical protein
MVMEIADTLMAGKQADYSFLGCNIICFGESLMFGGTQCLHRIKRVLMMEYDTQNYWGCGLCPSFGILN